jgi:hypothetical protein
MGPATGASDLRRPKLADVASDLQHQRSAGLCGDRPRRRQPPGRHGGGHRHRAVQRVRPAPDFDHLHPVQPVPRGAGGAAAVPAGPAARFGQSARPAGTTGARCRCRRLARIEERPARWRSTMWGSFRRPRCRSTWRPACRWARRWRPSTPTRGAGHAGQHRDQFPGRGAGVPGVAEQHPAADPGRGGHHVHRAGRAVRELHPPAHHPVHAAVGRGGGAAGAAGWRGRRWT